MTISNIFSLITIVLIGLQQLSLSQEGGGGGGGGEVGLGGESKSSYFRVDHDIVIEPHRPTCFAACKYEFLYFGL